MCKCGFSLSLYNNNEKRFLRRLWPMGVVQSKYSLCSKDISSMFTKPEIEAQETGWNFGALQNLKGLMHKMAWMVPAAHWGNIIICLNLFNFTASDPGNMLDMPGIRNWKKKSFNVSEPHPCLSSICIFMTLVLQLSRDSLNTHSNSNRTTFPSPLPLSYVHSLFSMGKIIIWTFLK